MDVNPVHNGSMSVAPTAEQTALDSCCTPAGADVLDAAEAQKRALVFKALADPNRLRLRVHRPGQHRRGSLRL